MLPSTRPDPRYGRPRTFSGITSLYYVIVVTIGFAMMRYEVNEAASAPGVEICIVISAGVVGDEGLTVNVTSTVGGSATCENSILFPCNLV